MKKIMMMGILIIAQGCASIAISRNPFCEEKNLGYLPATGLFPATRLVAVATIICAFPQMMSDSPRDDFFEAINLITIPLSTLFLCDLCCEIPIDTLCLPYDYFCRD